MEVLIIALVHPYNGNELTVFETLLSRGLTNLAWELYEFEHNVIHFNHRNPLRLLISTAGLEDLSTRILQTEAETSAPERINQLHEPITELHSRPTAQGRATPIEIAVIHGSLAIYQVLLPIVLQVVTSVPTRRILFTSLIDYAQQFRPQLIDMVQQDAEIHAQMNRHELISSSLRSEYFATAAELFTRFQGAMNEETLLELIVGLLADYSNNDNVEAIETFFSTHIEHFLSLGIPFSTALQQQLIDRVFMRAVQVQGPNRPRRDEVSVALLYGLANNFTRDQRQRGMDLARLSGQRQVLQSLGWVATERFEVSPDVSSNVSPFERKRRRRD
jgi:hypothetical protein